MNDLGIGFMQTVVFHDTGTEVIVKYVSEYILEDLQDSSFKSSGIFNDLFLSMYNYKKEPRDRFYFNQLEQKLLSHNVHISLPRKTHFLYSTFDWKIKQLIQGGFFDLWMEHYTSHSSLQKPEPDPDEGKVVLTMDHLSVGFTI